MEIIFDEHSIGCKHFTDDCVKNIFVFFNGIEINYIIHNSCFTDSNYSFFVDLIQEQYEKTKLISTSLYCTNYYVEHDLKRFRIKDIAFNKYYELVMCRARNKNKKYKYITKKIPFLDVLDIQESLKSSYEKIKDFLNHNHNRIRNIQEAKGDLDEIYYSNRQHVSTSEIIRTQEHLIKILTKNCKKILKTK